MNSNSFAIFRDFSDAPSASEKNFRRAIDF